MPSRFRKNVGMIIPNGSNQFFTTVAQNFQRELSIKTGFDLILFDSDGSKSREYRYLEQLLDTNIAGLVFISVGDSTDSFKLLENYEKTPVLIMDREVPHRNAGFVIGDDKQGIELGMEYLVQLGHKRIAHISGGLDTQPGRTRREAFLECLSQMELEEFKNQIYIGDFEYGSGLAAAEHFLACFGSEDMPTAFFCANDMMAISCMRKFQEAGFQVPRQVSFLGYDDIEVSKWLYPSLSTIKQDAIEIAAQGVRILVERIEKQETGQQMETSIPYVVQPQLAKRNSCDVVSEQQ